MLIVVAVGSGDIRRSAIEYLKRAADPDQAVAAVAARAVLEGRTVHIPDVLADPRIYIHLRLKSAAGVPNGAGRPAVDGKASRSA